MHERQILGEVEQLVLLAILRLGAGTYAVPIRAELERHGVRLTRGSIYVTLDRLERKGFVRSLNAYPRSLFAQALYLSHRVEDGRVQAQALRATGFVRRDFVRLCAALHVQ